MKNMFKYIILVLVLIVVIVVPLIFISNGTFGGTDDQAKNMINQINPNYKPWFSYIWQPPSGEIATLLFCIQTGIGSLIIGYIIGFLHGKKKTLQENKK